MGGWKRLCIAFCLVVVFIIGGNSLEVSACSCVMPPPPEEALLDAEAVFSGEVIKIVDNKNLLNGYGFTVYFAVDESWKGVEQSEVSVTTGYHDGDCGFPFEVGQSYLVYASLGDMNNKSTLSTSICQRTTNLSNAAEDLNELGKGQKIEGSNAKKDEHNDGLLNGSTTKIILAGMLVLAAALYVVWRIKKNARS
ncbi:hypothetical protein [Sporosarcina sp. OR05]|uniref:hypothetical protein n=1 Tax=Sporosarcina sp. OR05 TaxID=2969819 RepID=UPI00352BA9C8